MTEGDPLIVSLSGEAANVMRGFIHATGKPVNPETVAEQMASALAVCGDVRKLVGDHVLYLADESRDGSFTEVVFTERSQ